MTAYNHTIVFEPGLPGAAATQNSGTATITLRETHAPGQALPEEYKRTFFNNQGRSIALYTDRPAARTAAGQPWQFDIEGVVTFRWESGDNTICYRPGEGFTPDLLKYWTFHNVLPLFFTIEERYDFLHAGAVLLDDNAVLFSAESFGGKSTMTDFFIRKGHAMLSDDKVAVQEKEGAFLAVPSYPYHRPYRNTEDLGCFVNAMAPAPVRIRAVYELTRAAPDAEITMAPLSGVAKFKSLRFSSEINLSFLKPERFRVLSAMANCVPVYRVSVPWELRRLEEVYAALCRHAAAIEGMA